jgi:hypothetical protein
VTDPQVTVTRGFWAELFTAPRLITFGMCLLVGGMQVQQFRSELGNLRERVGKLETDLKIEYSAARADVLGRDLTAIREEQTRLRLEQEKVRATLEGLRRDLR